MRRIAPGCQSAVAPGGGAHSMLAIESPRSCTHGANTSPRTRRGFLDIESPLSLFVLHERWFLRLNWSYSSGVSRRKWTRGPGGLKMPDLRPYDKGWGAELPSCSGDWH